MRQDRRQKAKEEERDHSGGARGIAARPEVDGEAANPVKRQDAEACEADGFVVTAVVEEDAYAFVSHRVDIDAGRILRADAHEVGAKTRSHARQRRVLRLPGVNALIEPFHATSEVRGLVEGVAEYGIGGYDADGSEEEQGDHNIEAVALEEWQEI